MLPAASPRSTCVLEHPSKRRIRPCLSCRERAAVAPPIHPLGRPRRRRATAANPSMPLQAAGAAASARSSAARIGRKPHVALHHPPPRRRHRRAAAACNWHSKQPTLPVMGVVGCSEQPAVSEAASGCRHAVRHASTCQVKAAITAYIHAIAPSTKCKAEDGQA